MGGFYDELSDATDECLSTFGFDSLGRQIVLTWNGLSIPCFEGDEEEKNQLMLGGLVEETDLIVHVRVDKLAGGMPKADQAAAIGAKPYKVRSTSGGLGDPELRIILKGPHQRT